ncbi:uncharacterized protein ACHE_50080S [Aspergillus chevalieri]|uniref:Uncharacterized protein n=1 Tax=Aspergillus chevalieri TaxID=182096 RepID=A0A7R7VQK2_ASPCH|nr:uncharacterized protein ACHE_50080S [Aspergillus chevalieri]BCR88882.1 hypothetical protein ACHE_50080S [Aspergillus chevalieri]
MDIGGRKKAASRSEECTVNGRMERRRAWSTGYADTLMDISDLRMECRALRKVSGTLNEHTGSRRACCMEDIAPTRGRFAYTYERRSIDSGHKFGDICRGPL